MQSQFQSGTGVHSQFERQHSPESISIKQSGICGLAIQSEGQHLQENPFSLSDDLSNGDTAEIDSFTFEDA
jgi:hypothetical protein